LSRVYTFKAGYWSKDDLAVKLADSARAGLAISLVAKRFGDLVKCSEALEKLSMIAFRSSIGRREYEEALSALEELVECLKSSRGPRVVRLDA